MLIGRRHCARRLEQMAGCMVAEPSWKRRRVAERMALGRSYESSRQGIIPANPIHRMSCDVTSMFRHCLCFVARLKGMHLCAAPWFRRNDKTPVLCSTPVMQPHSTQAMPLSFLEAML